MNIHIVFCKLSSPISPCNSHQIPPSVFPFQLQALFLIKRNAESSLCYPCAIVMGSHRSMGNLPATTAPKKNDFSLLPPALIKNIKEFMGNTLFLEAPSPRKSSMDHGVSRSAKECGGSLVWVWGQSDISDNFSSY